MINWKEYTDNNGYIRFNNIPMVHKFIEKINKLSMYIPSQLGKENDYEFYNRTGRYASKEDYCEAWVKYPWKQEETDYCFCEREVFTKRISDMFFYGKNSNIGNWIIISELNTLYNNYNYKANNSFYTRKNEIVYICKFEYANTQYGNGMIKLYGTTITGESYYKTINVDEINSFVFRFCNRDEVAAINSILMTLTSAPEPCYERMWIKESYKGHYNDYLTDCEKYGYTPLPQVLIDNAVYEYAVNKEGTMDGGSKHPDYKYVNM